VEQLAEQDLVVAVELVERNNLTLIQPQEVYLYLQQDIQSQLVAAVELLLLL
jgi:hypothetical protein